LQCGKATNNARRSFAEADVMDKEAVNAPTRDPDVEARIGTQALREVTELAHRGETLEVRHRFHRLPDVESWPYARRARRAHPAVAPTA
jgi:hypothetical protein